MSKRDLKALGASVVNTSRLRSGTTARTERMADDDLEALGRVQELEQKLEMAEQAVNKKDKEIEAKNAEMEEMWRQAESELQEARELADDYKKTLEQERTDAKLLEAELERLTAVGERMEMEMRDQQELQRLRQVEQLRQQFDKERERHREETDRNAALVATLQKELEASKSTSESPCRESESGGGSSKKKSLKMRVEVKNWHPSLCQVMGMAALVRQPQCLRVVEGTPLVVRVALHLIVWPHLVVSEYGVDQTLVVCSWCCTLWW